ncbi:unnamed protein product [Leptidea sinapis]|uniref:CUB domain-containing protein n=1 Tax=Leptidea sinapis TaxID=189913 RepID=A0A5E4Q419_9NEOP|nr:unnamed protein product [Leptidea sinapis]
MVESLQMFLFLFKSKYRRKYSWFSPFLCSVLIVLLFCNGVLSRCSDHNCINGVCKNESCVCFEGWQGPECQHCGGKIKLTESAGVITDGPGNYSVSTQCSWLIAPPQITPNPPTIRIRLESFATECGWDHLYVYDGHALLHFFSDDAYAMEGFNITYAAYSCFSNDPNTNCSDHGECEDNDCNSQFGYGKCTQNGCVCAPSRRGVNCAREASFSNWNWLWREEGMGGDRPANMPPAVAAHSLLLYGDDILRIGGESFTQAEFVYRLALNIRFFTNRII